MKNSYIIGGIVAVVVIVGIGVFAFNQNTTMTAEQQAALNGQATTTATTTKAVVPSTKKTTTTTTTTTTTGLGSAHSDDTPIVSKSFTVNGNDTTADLKKIVVLQGTTVKVTFAVDAKGTYHGGLDFRSPGISTGTIPPGASETISFVATKSFSFVPYWPDTNEAKPYTIDVIVQ